VALAGEVDGVLAQATAHVDDGAVEAPGPLGFDHDGLGPAASFPEPDRDRHLRATLSFSAPIVPL
jgi:hypothetical protein